MKEEKHMLWPHHHEARWINHRHCEERSDVATHKILKSRCVFNKKRLDCHIALRAPRNDIGAED